MHTNVFNSCDVSSHLPPSFIFMMNQRTYTHTHSENLCHGGIMITASHLPCDKNGLKFFTKARGGYTKSDVRDLIEIAKLDVMKETQQYHEKGGKSSPTEKVN